MSIRQRQPRKHDNKHLDFIRGLPCAVCLDNTSTEAAHIRMGDRRAGKEMTGMGEKPSDAWVVPLCSDCHRYQHTMHERSFWNQIGIIPTFLALALYSVSGDHAAGEEIIRAYH